MLTYEELIKAIYRDMVREWNGPGTRLSYILDFNKVKEQNDKVTFQQLLDEFRKFPLIREAWDTGHNTITVFPK